VTHLGSPNKPCGAFSAPAHQPDDHHPSTDDIIVNHVLAGDVADESRGEGPAILQQQNVQQQPQQQQQMGTLGLNRA
jgi:hypothetical protein